MQRIWKYIYLCWGILCVVGGYRNLAPECTSHFDMPRSFIVVSFFFFCVAPLGISVLRNRFGIESVFQRPSLDRTPFSRRDILQVYRLFWVSCALTSLGGCFALPNADHGGVMMFWSSVAMSAGLFIGERIVYLVYAKNISSLSVRPISNGTGRAAVAGLRTRAIFFFGVMLVTACSFIYFNGIMAREGIPQIELAIRQETASLAATNESLHSLDLGHETRAHWKGRGALMTGDFHFHGSYSNQPECIFVSWNQADTNLPVDTIQVGSTFQELRTIWYRK